MKKLYTPIVLILALGIVILGAFLPKMAGSWQDSSDKNQEGLAVVSNVQLDTDSDSGTTIRAKLALLGGYQDSIELPVSMASMSEGDVFRVVQETIEVYQRSGLIPPMQKEIGPRDLTATVSLIRWDTTAGEGTIFWNVSVQIQDRHQLSLVVDDETERILVVSYYDFMAEEGAWQDSAQLDARLIALAEPYLDGLGDEFSEYGAGDVLANVEQRGERYLHAMLSWGDMRYGETRMEFLVTPDEAHIAIVGG